MPALKNNRHEFFAQAICAGMSITDAAAEAGYKTGTAAARTTASKLHAKANIQERIRELKQAAARRAEIAGADIITELGRVGLSDIRDLFTEDGKLLPIHKLPPDIARSVASVKVTSKQQPDENGNIEVVNTVEVKLWDKNSALEKLAKYLRLYDKKDDDDPAAKLLAAIMGSARTLPVASQDQVETGAGVT